MAYVLVENGVVTQKDIVPRKGFIEAPDDVVCGQIKQGDNYIDPENPEDLEYKEYQINQMIRSAFIADADPLYFKWQRGESTEEEWLNKVKEIKELKQIYLNKLYKKE